MIVAAFVVNELNDTDRAGLLQNLTGTPGTQEPGTGDVSDRRADLAAHLAVVGRVGRGVRALGGRADLWKARIDVPPLVKRLAKASGLRPEMLTARSLFV